MAGSLGNIEPFDLHHPEDWETYKERLDCFLIANDVTVEKKRAVFLSVCGKACYALIKSLVSPQLPTEKSYDELITALSDHFRPRSSEIASTVKFFHRSQQSGEAVATYLAELRRLASDCNFGANLTRQIRDRFVSGLLDENCQRRLLAEPELTLEDALSKAKASEAALQNQQDIRSKYSFSSQPEVKQIQLKTQNKRGWNPNKNSPATQNNSNMPCSGCGGMHRRQFCRFKDVYCRFCKKKAHIERVCRAKNKLPTKTKPTPKSVDAISDHLEYLSIQDDPPSIYNVNSSTKVSPVQLSKKEVIVVQLNGQDCAMEVDSGSEFSIISHETYRHLWPQNGPKIKPDRTRLRDFQQNEIALEGICSLEVKFKNHKATLPLLITNGKRTSLFGYSWFQPLGLSIVGLHHIDNVDSIKAVVDQFKEVFQPGLGTAETPPLHLPLDPNATPIRMKPRRVPYSLKHKIDEEINRLLNAGVIEPIANPKWSTPIVPVVKPDGSIRLCADYKVTINPSLRGYAYPIPAVADRLAELSGGKVYAKIDLANAYLQLPVDDAAAEAQTIITHRGAFRAKRLQFGVKTAPGIFQEFMEHLLAGIDGVLPYFDDILITADSIEQLKYRVREVLQRLKDKNLRARKDKCVFGVTSVEYLGYIIEEAGIRPTPSLVRAIREAPQPQNKEELQAFLGLLNFYHNFLPDKATVMAPLHKLLTKDMKWNWGNSQKQAFEVAKNMLSSDSLLTHFDEKKPIVLTCDASPYGLGCVLSHRMPDGKDAPIAFHSRSLTKVERNYSQLDREAAAIITGVKKFHNYLYGHHFTLITDHKPLLGLLSSSRETPTIISPRMLRWIHLLNAYDYEIVYRPGKTIGNADGLSRLPLPQTDFEIPPLLEVSFLEDLPSPPLSADQIARETRRDPELLRILQWVRNGWPANEMSPELKPFTRRQHELSAYKDCILWGCRVVIPKCYRKRVLEELHLSHPGVVHMKSLARSHVWWPGIDSDIELHIKGCMPCQESRHAPSKAPVHPWEVPRAPWSRLHIDFAGPMQGRTFLIVVDAYSKWLEVAIMPSMTSSAVIRVLRQLFAVHGLPDSIVSDNGTPFTSDEFKCFAERNQIRLIFVAPYHPSSNGQAERMVQTAKEGLNRISGGDWNQRLASFLLRQHITPNASTGQSPAEMLMGRRLKTCLDRLHPDYVTTRQNNQDSQIATACPRVFQSQDKVFIRSYRSGPKWIPATVESPTGPLSYTATTPDGNRVRRHVDQMRDRVDPSPDDTTPDITLSEETVTTPINSKLVDKTPNLNKSPIVYPTLTPSNPSQIVTPVRPTSTSTNPREVASPAGPISTPTGPSEKGRPRRQIIRPRYLQDYWTGEGM